MTAEDWYREYLLSVNSERQVLTLAEEQWWLDFSGINPVNPASVNPFPSSNNGPSSSSPTILPSRHINVNPVALKDSAYLCGNPGGVKSRRDPSGGYHTLPSCSWDWTAFASAFTNSSALPLQLRFVEDGSTVCTSDSGCAITGEVCGLSTTKLSAKSIDMTCGKLKGYWTADQICGVNPSFSTPFSCPLLYNLYGCVGGTVSCYSNVATSTCCGCADWWEVLNINTNVIFPNGTQQCVDKNPKWVNSIQPYLKPLKATCPTAYTFPFDDKSSTFICNNGESSSKPLDYYIILCPDSNAPSGGPISSDTGPFNTYRTIRFINKCAFDVWPAIAGGAVFNKATISLQSGQVTTCNSDSDCIDGTACVTTGKINQCFWKNPSPEGGKPYKLDAVGGANTEVDFHLPIGADTGVSANSKTPIVWSGIMTGRIDCTSFPCSTSDCGGNSASQGCEPSKGFIQPGGQAEFTFQVGPQYQDFYDVEVINGAIIGDGTNNNFGIEIYPDSLIT